MAGHNKGDAAHHDEDAAGPSTPGAVSEPPEAISFADVARMTHEEAGEPGALLQALRASPERTRKV